MVERDQGNFVASQGSDVNAIRAPYRKLCGRNLAVNIFEALRTSHGAWRGLADPLLLLTTDD